jgi:hypothetical protein
LSFNIVDGACLWGNVHPLAEAEGLSGVVSVHSHLLDVGVSISVLNSGLVVVVLDGKGDSRRLDSHLVDDLLASVS